MPFKASLNIQPIHEEVPFQERFALAAAEHFRYVEFWGWDDKDTAACKTLLKDHHLKLSSMSGDGPFSMCDPAQKNVYLDWIKKSIGVAKELDCPNLVIHSDALQEWPQYAAPLSGDYSYETKICAMFDCLKTMAPWAEEAGLTFVLEALNVEKDHLGNFLTRTAMAVDLVKATASANMKILYDAYHMYLNEGKIVETLTKYLDYIGYVHIADAPGRHEPGTGVINYRQVFKSLNRLGYELFAGFELYPETDSQTAIRAIQSSLDGIDHD